jgi:hypothetical protein
MGWSRLFELYARWVGEEEERGEGGLGGLRLEEKSWRMTVVRDGLRRGEGLGRYVMSAVYQGE